MADRSATTAMTSIRTRPWLRWILQAAVLITLILALHHYQTRGTVSGLAPEIRGRLLDGTVVSSYDFLGRPLMLQFWASWCPVCTMEQGSIHSIAQDHAVLSIALEDSSADEMRRWMADKGVSYPVILDASGEISDQFGVQGVPTSMIIDDGGRIRFVEVGYTTEIGLRLRLWWVGE